VALGRVGGAEFRPDIQGLRAIAVSSVVIYHLYPSALPGGYVGVDVFFVISGFLITGHLLRTFQRTGRVGFVEFYGRRARRLMPASALVLTVTWIASRLILPTSQLKATATQIRGSALYYENWVLARDAVSYLKSDQAPSPVQHFWSLSVEEQFYLFWPLLFLIAALVTMRLVKGATDAGAHTDEVTRLARAETGRRVMLILAGLVIAGSLAWSVYDTRVNAAAAYFVTTTRIWELAAGGLLALLSSTAADRVGRVGVLAWGGLVMIVVSEFVISGTSQFPGYIALLPVAGAMLAIACGSDRARLGPSRLLSLRPMVFLGGISYSVYLWHWPLIVLWKTYSKGSIGLLDGPAIAVVSIVLAWLTKVFVEDRVRMARFFAGHNWRSVGTVSAALVPVFLVGVFLADLPSLSDHKLDAKHPGAAVLAGDVKPPPHASPLPPLSIASTDDEISANTTCLVTFNSATPHRCRFGDKTHPKRVVALVGDSFAGEWSTALQIMANKHHWELVTLLKSGCPWTTTTIVRNRSPFTSCQQWGAKVRDDLLKLKPDVVLTSDRIKDGNVVGTPDGLPSYQAIAAGTTAYWKQLIAHNIPVVAIRESPEMSRVIPDCLSSHGATVAGCSTPRKQAVTTDTPMTIATRSMSGAVPLIDMTKLICGPRTCEPIVGNVVVYRDSHHLTNTYMKTLEPYLEKMLLKVKPFKRF
jgi:peptidoglycan/LPS O-acetylase OafA/YrhL